MTPLTQIALRLPDPVLHQAEHLVSTKQSSLIAAGRWSEAQRMNRSAVLREALERGLIILANEANKDATK